MSQLSTTRQESTSLQTVAAGAGIAGPIIFAVGFGVQDAVRDTDWVGQPVSALAIGSFGWVQTAAFVVLGATTIALAAGLWAALRSSRSGVAGSLLLALSGCGPLVAAAVPMRLDAGGAPVSPPGHVVGSLLFFLGTSVALVALARAMTLDPQWRTLAPYALLGGVAGLVCFLLMGSLVVPESAPLHEWFGVAQRAVVLLVLFPPRVALALRLLTVHGRL